MNKINFIVIIHFLFILLFGSKSAFSDDINWNLYKSNSFLWGQTTGCLLRFKFYADQTAINSEYLNKTQILTMLNSTIGNVEDYLNQLYQLGENNGHFVGMSKSQFSEFIKEISNEELKNNLAWLQTLTCYKALKDQNFIK